MSRGDAEKRAGAVDLMGAARSWAVIALLLGAFGCGPQPLQEETRSVVATPRPLIADGAHHGGQEGFYFLPPIAAPRRFAGEPVAGLSPVVRVEELGGRGTIASFSRSAGQGPGLGEAWNAYYVAWHTRESGVRPGFVYRIRIFLEGAELGFADARVVRSFRELVDAYRDEVVPLVGLPLLVTFRIESAAVPSSRCRDVVCLALDACHDAGTCDPSTGQCSSPAKPDGIACDDLDGCTQVDTCQAGACVGSTPVLCAPLDACHLAGTCDPLTGTCSSPVAPDGAACSDASLCTRADTCQAGVCAGGDPVVCPAPDACHLAGTCLPETGSCASAPAPDGTACALERASGACLAGACQVAACDSGYGDCDGLAANGCETPLYLPCGPPPPNPLPREVDVVLGSGAASAAIDPAVGGAVEVVGADGVGYRLDVPARAFEGTAPVTVTLTPVASIGRMPGGVPMLAGAQFGPDGLELLVPARLTVRLPADLPAGAVLMHWNQLGSGFHFAPAPVPAASGALEIQVRHFSGIMLGPQLPDLGPYVPTEDPSEMYEEKIAMLYAWVEQARFAGALDTARGVMSGLLKEWAAVIEKAFDDIQGQDDPATRYAMFEDATLGFLDWHTQIEGFCHRHPLSSGIDCLGRWDADQLTSDVYPHWDAMVSRFNAAVSAAKDSARCLAEANLCTRRVYLDKLIQYDVATGFLEGTGRPTGVQIEPFGGWEVYCGYCDKLATDHYVIEIGVGLVGSNADQDEYALRAGQSLQLRTQLVSWAQRSYISLNCELENIDRATVRWSSSDGHVATVAGGLVSGHHAGSATITASDAGGCISHPVRVLVSAVADAVQLEPPVAMLRAGKSLTLQATARDGAGEVVEGCDFRWAVDAPAVVSLSPQGATAVVTGLGPLGRARVTAACGEREGAAELTVVGPPVAVTLSPPTVGLVDAEKPQDTIQARVTDANGNLLPREARDCALHWLSSDTLVAVAFAPDPALDQVALVMAVGKLGRANITAACGDVWSDTAYTAVVVVGVPDRVVVSPATLEIADWWRVPLNAAAYDRADQLLVTGLRSCTLRWFSGNVDSVDVAADESRDTVATVIGVTPGTAAITANCDDVMGYSEVACYADPCHVAGTWQFTIPAQMDACGVCAYWYPGWTGTAVIRPSVAAAGGWVEGPNGGTWDWYFDPGTCTIRATGGWRHTPCGQITEVWVFDPLGMIAQGSIPSYCAGTDENGDSYCFLCGPKDGQGRKIWP